MAVKRTIGQGLGDNGVPLWVYAIIQEYALILGLDGWDLNICLHDAPGEDGDADGVTYLQNARYRMATIVLRRALVEAGDNPRLRSVIHHELMHVMLSRISQAVDNILKRIEMEDDREFLGDLYSQAEEETIETVTRTLEPYIVKRNALAAALAQAAKDRKADQKMIKSLQSDEKRPEASTPKRKTFTKRARGTSTL